MRLPEGSGLSAGGGWAVLARAVNEELASVGVPVLLGVRPVEGRVPLLVALRTEEDREAVADRVAAALRAGVERAGLRHTGTRAPTVVVGATGGWTAASAGCGTPRRPRPPPRASANAPGTTRGDSTSTCCCGGCGTTRTSPRSSTAPSARCAPTTAGRSRRCCPPWRPIWRTPDARRRPPANCTSTARPSTTGSPASGNSSAPTSTTRRPCWR